MRTLSNIYICNGALFNPGIFRTLIQYLRNIQNHWCSVFLMNPDIFRTLIYPQLLCILRSKHVWNPAEYLRWRILLRTLCNYSKFRCPIYSKLLRIQNQSVSATPLCISYTLYLKNEEKCFSLPPSCWYWSLIFLLATYI